MPAPDPDAVLRSLPDPVVVVDAAGRLLWGNGRAEAVFGRTLVDARGTDVSHLVHPDDLVTALSSLASVQAKDLGSTVDLRLRVADGSWVRFEGRGWSGFHDPRVQGVVVVLRRLDDRDGWTVTAGDARRRAAVLDHAPNVTLLVDSHGRVEGASRAFTARLGRPLEDTLGTYLADLVVPEHRRAVRSELEALLLDGGTRSFEASLEGAPGREPSPYWLTAADLLDDDAVRAVVISGVEIAPLVAARQELAHRATHDPLTGLADRVLVLERLAEALQRSVGTTARVGLVFCDVDGFGEVNDAHGHAVGDEVLVEIAARVRGTLRPGDSAGRLGGDQLVVVAVRDSVAEVERAMAEVVAAVEQPIPTRAGPVEVTLSAGCAVARYGADPDDLLRRADRAMYRRKHTR